MQEYASDAVLSGNVAVVTFKLWSKSEKSTKNKVVCLVRNPGALQNSFWVMIINERHIYKQV